MGTETKREVTNNDAQQYRNGQYYTHKNLCVKDTRDRSFFYLASNDSQSRVKALEAWE